MSLTVMMVQGFLIGVLATKAGLSMDSGAFWLFAFANPLLTVLYHFSKEK